MRYISFKDEEKIKLFDQIALHFYENNFGQMSKADMELLMFRFYIEKLIAINRAPDGTIDYNKCSDYIISKDLGITQQKVRNLKVKNQLVNPIDYDWKLALAQLTKNARFDPDSRKITLNIPDPNLYLEIQNFIEEHGAYVEKQLNSKILQIKAEYYIDLVLALEPESSRKAIIKEMKKSFAENNKNQTVFDEKNIGKTLVKGTVDLSTIVSSICSIVSPSNYIGVALLELLTTALNITA